MKKSVWFQRKQSSLLPLPTERTKTRFQSFRTFTTSVQKVKNATKTSVVWAGPQNLLAGLKSAPDWATSSTVPRPPCKLSDHHLEQLWYIVTLCPFTQSDSAARSQYATGWRSRLRHVDSLDQTCRAVWPHYARRKHKKKERERETEFLRDQHVQWSPSHHYKFHVLRLSLNLFVKIFGIINSPRSMSFCISARQHTRGASSNCWDFIGTHF